MSFLPAVVHAEYRGGFRIRLVFNDGSENTIDFEPWLDTPIFEPLRKREYFQRFFVDGGTIAWPNGADIAPETLYDAEGRRPRPRSRTQSSHRRGPSRSRGVRSPLRG